MKFGKMVFAALALVLVLAPLASAQDKRPTVEIQQLGAGGKTIGGPAISAGGTYIYSGGGPILDVCLTVAYVTGSAVDITFLPGPVTLNVAPSRSQAQCYPTEHIHTACVDGPGTCKFMWRVDRMD
jgi:hypothetical protein